MKTLTISVARIIFAIPFAIFGIFHFMNASHMAGMVPSFLPFQIGWIYLTGIALIAASISFIINLHVKLAGYLLALMLLIFILALHLPGLGAEETMQMSMTMLLKDLALLGGALLVAITAKK